MLKVWTTSFRRISLLMMNPKKIRIWKNTFMMYIPNVRLLTGTLLSRFPRNLLLRFCWELPSAEVFRIFNFCDQPGESTAEIRPWTTFCRGLLDNQLSWSTRGIYWRDSIEIPFVEVFWIINCRVQLGESTTEIKLLITFAEVFRIMNHHDQPEESTVETRLWITFYRGLSDNQLPWSTMRIYCRDSFLNYLLLRSFR